MNYIILHQIWWHGNYMTNGNVFIKGNSCGLICGKLRHRWASFIVICGVYTDLRSRAAWSKFLEPDLRCFAVICGLICGVYTDLRSLAAWSKFLEPDLRWFAVICGHLRSDLRCLHWFAVTCGMVEVPWTWFAVICGLICGVLRWFAVFRQTHCNWYSDYSWSVTHIQCRGNIENQFSATNLFMKQCHLPNAIIRTKCRKVQ